MDAPLSLTMTMTIEAGRPSLRTKASVSRLAVPLPMAIASIWYLSHKARTTRPAWVASRSECVMKSTSWCSSLPWRSSTTVLQPVR